jgi:hypothetical protein
MTKGRAAGRMSTQNAEVQYAVAEADRRALETLSRRSFLRHAGLA